MTKEQIFQTVDHTQLAAFSTWVQIERLCKEAIEYKTASVCIPPSYIKRVHEAFPELNLCTVIGFPLGYNTKECKVQEVKQAIEEGASEVDMVINIGDVKNGDYDKITEEIQSLKEAAGDNILKVIVEACYLTEEEKVKICECVTKGGADYIKTSTGFGSGGAAIEDIDLFKKYIGSEVKMKAAGGIRTREAMEAFIEHGCSRIGCSGAIAALNDDKTETTNLKGEY